MNSELDDRLRQIFSKLFPVAAGDLRDDARRGELDGWDSLGHLDLVNEIETQFQVSIDTDRALEIETFGETREMLQSLLAHG